MSTERPWMLVKLGEPSDLKTRLNSGIASLARASAECFWPHTCLNGKTGVQIIRKIANSPQSANTQIHLHHLFSEDGSRIWLNTRFTVYLDECSWPNHVVKLTPRQTAYIVERLQPEFRGEVLARVKAWYEQVFKEQIRSGLERLDAQFASGNLLVRGTHENLVFDLHNERGLGHDRIPYTEFHIVGDRLATDDRFFGYRADYREADNLVARGRVDW